MHGCLYIAGHLVYRYVIAAEQQFVMASAVHYCTNMVSSSWCVHVCFRRVCVSGLRSAVACSRA